MKKEKKTYGVRISITTNLSRDRKIGCVTVFVLALNSLFFTKGIIASIFGLIVALISIRFAYKVWKRDL